MNTIRTASYLVSVWRDSPPANVTAQDGRDLIVSAFGWQAVSDPTPQNDSVDTAGIGQFFSAGNRWRNRATLIDWVCYDGTPGAAVWAPAWSGAPGAAPPSVVGTVDFGPVNLPSSPPAGLTLTPGGPMPDGTTVLVANAGMSQQYSGPWQIHSGLWTRPAWYTSGAVLFGAIVHVLESSLGVGWENQRLWVTLADAGWVVDATGPLWEQPTNGAARCFALDSTLTIVGTMAALFPEIISMDPQAGFKVNVIGTSNLPPSFGPGGITLSPVTLGVTPYTLQVDVITGDIFYVDASGTPQQVQTGSGGGGFTPVSLSGNATSPLYSTVFDKSGANMIAANLGVKNTQAVNPGHLNLQVTIFDAWGHSVVLNQTVSPGNVGDVIDLISDDPSGNVFLPLTRIKIEVATSSGASPQTWQIKGAYTTV